MPETLKKSPFYHVYNTLSDEIEWDDWGGFSSPMAVINSEQELKAVRTNAIVFDMSPVVKFSIKGPEAVAYMNKLTTRQMDIATGRVTYSCWCNVQGKLIDDGTAFRIAEDEFILMPGENHEAYFKQVAAGYDVTISDITSEIASLTVQGKKSLSIIQQLAVVGLENLRPFCFADFDSIAGTIRISRTGFFGDLGYELWMDYKQGEAIWHGLLNAGATPCGMDTLCNARLEGGLIIPEEEFDFIPVDPMNDETDDFNRSPLEMDLGFLVNFNKGDFIGRDALLKEQQQGSVWANVGIELAGSIAAEQGNLVLIDGEEVGFITSGLYSTSIEKNIGLASIKTAHAQIGNELSVSIDGNLVGAIIVKKPFINPQRKGQTPAPAL